MNFKFRIAPAFLLLPLLACGPGRKAAPVAAAPGGGDAPRLALLLDYVGGD
jgi:hypothetical protein